MKPTLSSGRTSAPVRVVIYGPSGIGKSSTIAALFPKHEYLAIDIERSTLELDVDRVIPQTWEQLCDAVKAATAGDYGPRKLLSVETGDWAEKLCTTALCTERKWEDIEAPGFGKGYPPLEDKWREFLSLLDAAVAAGMHVVIVAHSQVKKVSPPEHQVGWDRYELKMTNRLAGVTKEWAESLLLLRYETEITATKDKKIKGSTTQGQRCLCTTQTGAWDAKSRIAMQGEIYFDTLADGVEILRPLFARTQRAATPTPAPTPCAAPASVPGITAEQVEKLNLYRKVDVCVPVIERALKHYGQMLDTLSEEQASKVIDRCQEEMNAASPPAAAAKPAAKPATPGATAPALGSFPFQPSVKAWLEKNEDAINRMLVANKVIGATQTWKDLPHDVAEKINAKPSRYAKLANCPEPTA